MGSVRFRVQRIRQRPWPSADHVCPASLVAGVSLIFGGEMGDFTRCLVLLVFVISMIVSASALLSVRFNTSGLAL